MALPAQSITAHVALTHSDAQPLANPCLEWNTKGQLIFVGCQPSAETTLPNPHQPLLVLTAGLINLHTHLAFSGYTAVPRQPTMGEWLAKVIDTTRSSPVAQSSTPAQRIALGLAEALRFGTVALADVAPLEAAAEVLNAMQGVGLLGNVAAEVFHPARELQPAKVQTVEVAYRALAQLALTHGLSLGLSPHSPYNVSPTAWRHWVQGLRPALVHTHLAESQDEAAWLAGDEASGITTLHRQLLGEAYPALPPLASDAALYLQAHKLLTPPMLVAHGVTLSAQGWEALGRHGIGVAHCPRSNLALHGQTLAGEACLHHSLWGFGTDSHLSTPNLDLRQEAALACQLHGWQPQQAWYGLTQGAAACLGLGDTLGSLAVAKTASFCLWEVAPPPNGQGWESLLQDTNALAKCLLNQQSTQLAALWLRGQPRYPIHA
jgi:cytosine/adenosine deaminase-related metal-dependent hydrolase